MNGRSRVVEAEPVEKARLVAEAGDRQLAAFEDRAEQAFAGRSGPPQTRRFPAHARRAR
jgi:hypothetical protein